MFDLFFIFDIVNEIRQTVYQQEKGHDNKRDPAIAELRGHEYRDKEIQKSQGPHPTRMQQQRGKKIEQPDYDECIHNLSGLEGDTQD